MKATQDHPFSGSISKKSDPIGYGGVRTRCGRDNLQTLLWNHYGDAIQRTLQEPPDIRTRAPDFDDPVPF